jgi:hypothetical protein
MNATVRTAVEMLKEGILMIVVLKRGSSELSCEEDISGVRDRFYL